MAVDIFLKLSSIKGESQDSSHKQEIDILNWGLGMTQSGTTHMGGGGGGGKVDVQDINIIKYVDQSSNDLIKKCTSGKHIDAGLLTVRKSGGDAPVEYFKLHMEMIIVSSYTTGGSKDGLDRIEESLTLNFRRFNIEYTMQDDKGADAGTTNAGWDIAENKEWNGTVKPA
ncbi:Hcp family type VI secretion system effector [Litoreibacter albidus]|uniref:Type VI secretion system secreted protein Hcp n=1 Tax=Litoreibacter albidus TaxID=670155 RepID=A0A1H3D9I7_9RHOB|nr:type VI secretion system tube protein Hcp [Litoreibacter albidus]SDX62960.1 type VI secretion system secreted protein Hcp [Litoreibacter albidus]